MLHRTQFFIREHVGMLKLSGTYDILDPQTKAPLGQAREEISGLVKFLRLLIDKSLMSTRISVYEGSGERPTNLLFSLHRGPALVRPKVFVRDATGAPLGHFQSKAFSLGGAFRVFTADGTEVALVQGDWKGWNFRFLSGTTELGVVTKKWSGFGKELFTTADSYLVHLHGTPAPSMSLLLLAAGLAIDTVLKEKN